MGLIVQIGADLSKFEREMNKATKDITYLGDKMGKVGSAMTKGLTLPIVGVGAASIATSTNFEKSMSNVAALSGATGDTFDELREKAKELGANTQKSASEAADAMGYMALAGWDTNAMLSATEPILKLSVAGNMELAKCSDLVTDSMGSMGMQVDELDGYLNLLCKTQATSNTNAQQLMEAYILCGGTMKNLNVDMSESAAVIGVLANQGIKGSEAGTALNSVLINMTTGSGQAGDAMEELGLTCFDSNGKFKGMEVVLSELQGALSGMTDEQKNTYLAMIGGKTQVDTLNKLMQGMADGSLSNLKEKLSNTSGSLEEMYGIMADNTAGSIDNFESALEGLAIEIGEHILPIFRDVVDKLTEWVSWFGELTPEGQRAILIVAGVAAAIGPLILIISKMIEIYKAFKVISTAVKAVNLATTISFMGVTAPVWAVIAVITAVIAIFALMVKQCGGVKEALFALGNSLGTAIKLPFQLVGVFIKNWVDYIVGVVKGFANIVIGIFTLDFGKIQDGVRGVLNSVINLFQNTFSDVINVVRNAINKVLGFFNFKWELPKIKLPHFSISGKFSLNPPQIPKFGVDWYSSGGIFMKPTVLGGIGVGDAINGRGNGPEAVLPLKKLPELLGLDDKNTPQQITTVIQLDGREIARATSGYIDTELRKSRDGKSRANGGM